MAKKAEVNKQGVFQGTMIEESGNVRILGEDLTVGANLFTNTSPLETKSNNEWIQLGNDTTAIFDANGLITYTVSFDAKSEIAGSFNLYSTSGSDPKYTWPNTDINLTTDWQHFSYTFTPTISKANGTWSRISIYGIYGTGKIPSIKNVKLERGSISTPWIPNVADAAYSKLGFASANHNIHDPIKAENFYEI